MFTMRGFLALILVKNPWVLFTYTRTTTNLHPMGDMKYFLHNLCELAFLNIPLKCATSFSDKAVTTQ